MTVKAPRSKPLTFSKPLSPVSVKACPYDVSPQNTSLELAPVVCQEEKQLFYFCKRFVCVLLMMDSFYCRPEKRIQQIFLNGKNKILFLLTCAFTDLFNLFSRDTFSLVESSVPGQKTKPCQVLLVCISSETPPDWLYTSTAGCW